MVKQQGSRDPQARPVFAWARDHREFLAGRGIEIVRMSADDCATNAAIADSEKAHIALLSDPSAWGARVLGLVPRSDMDRTADVWSLLLGSEGRVLAVRRGLIDPSAVVMLQAVRPTGGNDFRAIDLLK